MQAVLDTAQEKENRQSGIIGELRNGQLPSEEKSLDRLSDEASVLIGAAADAPTLFLTGLTFHLLANPEVLKRLRSELVSVMPDPAILPSWKVLDKLPYLVSYLI